MSFGSWKRKQIQDVGSSEEEHEDAEAERETLKLISSMTMMMTTLAQVKEMMQKGNLLENLPNIPSLMR
jgi:hypothetical protein